jgi:hypothetical protein
VDWIQQAVSNFLGAIGLPGATLDAGGFLRLRTGSGGAIEFQHVREGESPSLMLAWSEPDPWDLPRHLKAALRLADFHEAANLPLLVAAHAEQLVLATRMQERSVSQSSLEDGMDYLRRMHEQIRNS